MTAVDRGRKAIVLTSGRRETRIGTLLVAVLESLSFGCGQSVDLADPGHLPESTAPAFEAASTVGETWRQHKRLPDPSEKIWWDVNGPDMLWNNKNLHQIVPTARTTFWPI
jgi:hypothetical protein